MLSMSWGDEGGARTAVALRDEWAASSARIEGDRAPAICFDRSGRRWCATADEQGRVWLCALDRAGVMGERSLVAGALTDHAPSVVCWRDKLCVAIVDRDGALFLATGQDPTRLRFRGPASIAVASGPPSIAATCARLHIAFLGTDRRVYVGSSDDGRSIGYRAVSMPRRAASSPTLSAWGENIALCAIDDNGHVYTASSHEGVELALVRRGGAAITRSTPAIALHERTLHAMLLGTDRRLYRACASVGHPLDFSALPAFGEAESAPRLCCARDDEPVEPRRSRVVGALFVARDVDRTALRVGAAIALLDRHLQLARERYRRWLEDDTFALGDTVVVEAERSIDHYAGDGAWERVRDEVLASQADNADTSLCTYVILFARGKPTPEDCFGSAGPNHAEGSGAVIVELSSLFADAPYPFQSTLVHELGHAFGLPHVSAYGESMEQCESIMSYNPRHWTRGLSLPEPDATLLPEELLALGQNEVALPDFRFDPAKHNPSRRPLRTPRDE